MNKPPTATCLRAEPVEVILPAGTMRIVAANSGILEYFGLGNTPDASLPGINPYFESNPAAQSHMHSTLLVAGIVVAIATSPASAMDGDSALGERIYREGLLPDGSPLTYRSAAGVVMSGRQAACIQCHRRSGMGSREGVFRVPPITGPALYARPHAFWPRRAGREVRNVVPLRHLSREAYDDETLVRAIMAGLDSSGRPLNDLMPRYALDKRAGRAVVAYLRRLSAAPVPGVETEKMYLATIVAPDAEPVRGEVVVRALEAWAGRGGVSGIVTPLRVWRLEGPESTWGDQLRQHYRERPVFAVISGAGGVRWNPIRDFCEEMAVPCLFPVVDLASGNPDDFYSVYFSDGIPLEVRMLVRHLKDAPAPSGRVVQLVADAAGEAAAALFAASLEGFRIETRRWRMDPAGSLLHDLQPDDVLVAWLRPEAIRQLVEALPEGPASRQVLFSNLLASARRVAMTDFWRARVRWLSFHADPRRLHGRAIMGLVPWAARFGLDLDEEQLLAEVYAATYFFGDALARMQGVWNREYLIETLESSVDNRPAGAAFYGLSLGPGQRVAAKGGHLLGHVPPDLDTPVPVGPRIVP